MILPMGMDASMVPPCHLDGDLRDGEPEKAKPLPGDRRLGSPNRCQPEATGDGEGWRFRQDRASSGSTFPAAVPCRGEVVARTQLVPGSSGLGEHPGTRPLSQRALPWHSYRDLLAGLPGRGVSPPTMLAPIHSLHLACFKQLLEHVQTIPVRIGMAEVYWLSPRC